MPNLYEIAVQVEHLDELLEQIGGELTPELEFQLAEIEKHLAVKTESYIAVMEIAKQREAYWKEMKQKCEASRKACDTTYERLKERVTMIMLKMGKMHVSGKTRGFKLQACAHSFKVDDANLIPDRFKKEKTVVSVDVDYAAIKAELMSGKAVPGCRLEGGQSLRVVNV